MDSLSEKKLLRVKPDLVSVVRRANEIGPPFTIVQGNRTQAEQNAIYAQGRTKPGKIVTWTTKSKHIGGNAVDFAALVNNKISWNDKLYPAIARAFKQASHELGIPIEWGGDWHTKDWGHIQLSPASIPQGIANLTPHPLEASDPRWAVATLQGLGLTRLDAIAYTANLIWESGGHDHIEWGATGDRGHSHGAGQWNDRHGRFQGLQQFARNRSMPWTDPETQLAFLVSELNTSELFARNKVMAAETLPEKMAAALTYWRPSIPHADRRLAIAQKLEPLV